MSYFTFTLSHSAFLPPLLLSPSPVFFAESERPCFSIPSFPFSTAKIQSWSTGRLPMKSTKTRVCFLYNIPQEMLSLYKKLTTAMKTDVYTKLIFVFFGVYLWEVIQTCPFEWSLFTGKRKFAWPLVCLFFSQRMRLKAHTTVCWQSSCITLFLVIWMLKKPLIVFFFLCRYCMLWALIGLSVFYLSVYGSCSYLSQDYILDYHHAGEFNSCVYIDNDTHCSLDQLPVTVYI